jgi:hypothetical protein
MTNTVATQSIVAGPQGLPINVNRTIAQIGIVVRMRVGYVSDSLMYAEDYIKFQVSCAPKRRHWVIVKLDGGDTYSVEFGRLKNKFDWHIAAQVEGIYGDVLGEVIERLYQEVYA